VKPSQRVRSGDIVANASQALFGHPYLLGHENQTFPAGFVVPTQPIKASSPSDAGWVHEIKDDGYRLIVRRGGPKARLYAQRL
jgi:ATP-dependent DNA ligase